MKQASRFCSCIKKVSKTLKMRRSKSAKESIAIAICVKSVLQTRGKTLKKFKCRGTKGQGSLQMQAKLNTSGSRRA